MPRTKLSWTINLGLSALVIVIGLCVFEIVLRVAYLDDSFATRNFTVDPVNQQHTNQAAVYDPAVGYYPRPGISSTVTSHDPYGLRYNYNRSPDKPLVPIEGRGILAVGDSFTYGSDVNDDQTWPAYLERELSVPVANAGVGGYGWDQSVLRAEQLMERLNPRALIVACIPNCVGRNNYSVNGGLVKPYFDIVDNRLELRNVPVPMYQPAVAHVGALRKIFGRSYFLYWLADRVGYLDRWLVRSYEYRSAHQRGIEVSCLLMDRLRELGERHQAQVLVFVQYAGTQIAGMDNTRESSEMTMILECAQRSGLIVVDAYDELRAIFESDPDALWNFYLKTGQDENIHTGHMSPVGNEKMAAILARAIRQFAPQVIAPEQPATTR